MSRWRLSPARLRVPAVVAAALLAAAAGRTGAAGERLELTFDRFNGSYEDLSPELVPIDAGGIALRLRSEHNSVRLLGHRIVLRPQAGSGHRLEMTAELEAIVVLEAEMSVAGLAKQLQDEVEAPRQRLRLNGLLDIERQDGAYLLTVLEAPPTLEVAIVSGLGARLVASCRLVPWVVGCDGLERALSILELPLPRRGSKFLLDSDELTAGERQRIDSYLDSTGALPR